MSQLKIFLSSTCYDLKQIRADLFDYFYNQGYTPYLSENHDFPINPQKDTIENCIENVKKNTDIFVLVVGNRYGYQIENGKSITNTEYLYAKKLGIPIYIFIYRQIISILPIWKKNQNGDFSDSVDSTKIFEFVQDLRETDNNWCFEFEKAQDIIKVLKTQFSYLFKEALNLKTQFKSNLPDFYKKLSTDAINILLNREDMFEVLFFAQALEDELTKFEELKYDLEYHILFKSKTRIDNDIELQKWLTQNLQSLDNIIDSGNNLFNKAFKTYYGEPGVPSDLKGLFYVAGALARLYGEMINWYNDIKSTSVEDEYKILRDSFAQYTIKAAEQIWKYPKKIKDDIHNGLERIKNGEESVNVESILKLEIDDDSMEIFHREMDKLTRKYN
ncbi:DUF4062 domain-containing protein [uncultured Sunxiuqinia sp.]|uniref:DUF4062 domain-containing protein n=1 Tax=Sunxiuqinia rutila TaxID=1397841 RepID=UPI00260599EF|nr:DUF4062 domain-containing protein [uncultured Sunxiuqinia sp.]